MGGPTGQCPVCLGELGDGADAAVNHLRLPCYHILHAACFAQVWEAEWLRQKSANAAVTISDAVVACPQCRQVVSWAAVLPIHPLLKHLLVVVVSESDNHDEERDAEEQEGAEADEE